MDNGQIIDKCFEWNSKQKREIYKNSKLKDSETKHDDRNRQRDNGSSENRQHSQGSGRLGGKQSAVVTWWHGFILLAVIVIVNGGSGWQWNGGRGRHGDSAALATATGGSKVIKLGSKHVQLLRTPWHLVPRRRGLWRRVVLRSRWGLRGDG